MTTSLYDNQYKYIKELGKGGFGSVFLAKAEVSNRFVAIKQLNNKDKEQQQNIIREIEVVAKFKHQNIVTFYHHFWQEGLLFLVMEYCEGGSLRDRIRKEKMTAPVVFKWIQTLAECLRTVHKKGIIHHDIKPDNILFTENGTIKISDFGVANTGGGTSAYISPESYDWRNENNKDQRVDIYALGVTLMESLIGKNPFSFITEEKIIELHKKADFQINDLQHWQQEIILKAINIIPELRFQYMVEFEEAIKAMSIPVVFNKELLKASELVEYAEKALKKMKWKNALKYIEFANEEYPDNVSVLTILGKYYLLTQKINHSKEYIEKALQLNPRLDLQKDLGRINLENKNYPIAISLLSDHLHRHPADYEAYNLLLRCYYETKRYEPAMELAKMLMESNPKLLCFANNYYISYVLHNKNGKNNPDKIIRVTDCHFVAYNKSVFQETEPSYTIDGRAPLKSKLLFMDYPFNDFKLGNISITNSNHEEIALNKPIIKIGRENYACNDISVKGGTTISRRHCIIINAKNNSWLYDLGSTGTYLNGERVNNKALIFENCTLKIGTTEFEIKPDREKLL